MEAQPTGGSTAQLQDLLLETEDLTEFLHELTTTTAGRLSHNGTQVHCAVTLLRHRKPITVTSSGPEAAALDETQNRFPDGPCLSAIREHTVVRVADVRAGPRWADYLTIAATQGVRSVLGTPFELDGEAKAGLNVYSTRTEDFDQPTIESVHHEVVLASHALRLAVRLARHRDTAADLAAAMTSRTTIDVAVGIIMGQSRCTQEKAFEILRAASSHRNTKLRDLAAELVATVGKGPATTHVES